ncbi:PS-10 peptidase S37 [Terracoccus luteus]|uniref:PS-10 peptidase S37 n=1 Tax=Terracoccus luteus TaxID=53356 RepID=A0A495Y0K7_9MICO|nr:S28 family serine protease [Terracoccus luteus]RKT80077.1 PS-10 peptidase S37 [Terracoccus luteus]
MPALSRTAASLSAAALIVTGLTVTGPAAGGALASPGTPASTSASTSASAGVTASDDILDRIRAVPGVTSVSEGSVPAGYRFFLISFRQQVDHRDPAKGTFEQRLTLLHKGTDRPTVMYTSGYGVSQSPGRAEPTQIVDGNQLSMEYRFFSPSIPASPSWPTQLTIWQAATDQHDIIEAFKTVYDQSWLTTGGSKGGMTATYHRRFYPDDVQGSVPYVAPNDVVDTKDVYNEFLSQVGEPACRDAITAVQRRALGPARDGILRTLRSVSAEQGLTWKTVGSLEKAYESAVVDTYFAFWQYQPESACGSVPDARTATRDEIYAFLDGVAGLTFYSDQTLAYYAPYYYQAATQLGSPEPYENRLGDLLKFPGADVAKTFVPRELKPLPRFDRAAMPDVDRWASHRSTQMLYVYGENDPWSAEPFDCGPAASAARRDCFRFYVPGGNHGSSISQLPEAERAVAVQQVREWAGVATADASARSAAAGSWSSVPALDHAPEWTQRRTP